MIYTKGYFRCLQFFNGMLQEVPQEILTNSNVIGQAEDGYQILNE